MGTSRSDRAQASQRERARRHRLAGELAAAHDGVVTHAMLLDRGLTRGQIEVEIEHGAWTTAGRHTVSVTADAPSGRGLWWRALWESGSRSVLDGPTALLAAGLTGWDEPLIHVSVPNKAAPRHLDGVRHHRLRDIGPAVRNGLRRTYPAVAVVRAAQWARSDRAAATLVAMTVQQRLARPQDVMDRWARVTRSARRLLLDAVIRDVCDGAHSLPELDFAIGCRRRGLPEPTRQAVRTGRNGRVYLDVLWEEYGVHAEIQGAQHQQGLAGVDDALRTNDLAMRDRRLVTLQVPVLGLRTRPDAFYAQVGQALRARRRRPGA